MRKTLISILILALFSFSALAREAYKDEDTYFTEEVNFSYGRISVPGIANTLGAVFGAAFSFGLAQPSHLDVLGAGSLSYYHWFNSMFAVGCDSSMEMCRLTFKNYKGKDADGNKIYEDVDGVFDTYLSLMPAVKGRWLTKPHFGIYSKAAVGGLMQFRPATETTDSDGNTVHEPASVNFRVAYQLSPLGFEFGGTQWKGFTELGFGMEGMILAGIRYSF